MGRTWKDRSKYHGDGSLKTAGELPASPALTREERQARRIAAHLRYAARGPLTQPQR